MYSDSKKIQLIEEVLKLDDNKVLKEIESVLSRASRKRKKGRIKIDDFFGIWSPAEANKIEKAIEEGCEQVNPDDWK